jgi:sulfide:quinone oxidoreductase
MVANELRRLLPAEHRVTIIERTVAHAFAPSFLWVMSGDRQPHQVTRDVRQLVRPGVEVVEAEVRGIDLAAKRVDTGRETLSYDYLLVALGAELAPDSIPGLAAAHTFYTLDGAARLRAALDDVSTGTVAVVVAPPYKCPGAPHEAAMLLADVFRRRGLAGKVDVHLFTPEPQPMPVAGPTLGDGVRQMLEQRGVSFHPLHKLMEVRPQTRELIFEGKAPVGYKLLAAIPPHRAPAVARQAGLTNDSGWIPVDRPTLATKHEHVFAIGDITTVAIPGRWKPDVPLLLPKAGVFAHVEALVVARRIADEIAGRAATDTFCGDGFCMLEAGEELAGIAYGDFFHEPAPDVHVRSVGRAWHLGKVLFEQYWLAPWGVRRALLRSALEAGSRLYGVPVKL